MIRSHKYNEKQYNDQKKKEQRHELCSTQHEKLKEGMGVGKQFLFHYMYLSHGLAKSTIISEEIGK